MYQVVFDPAPGPIASREPRPTSLDARLRPVISGLVPYRSGMASFLVRSTDAPEPARDELYEFGRAQAEAAAERLAPEQTRWAPSWVVLPIGTANAVRYLDPTEPSELLLVRRLAQSERAGFRPLIRTLAAKGCSGDAREVLRVMGRAKEALVPYAGAMCAAGGTIEDALEHYRGLVENRALLAALRELDALPTEDAQSLTRLLGEQ